jgi:hypothetical protein
MPDEQFFREPSNVRETAIRILTESSFVVIGGLLPLHFHHFGDRSGAGLASFPLLCSRRFGSPGDCSSQSHNPDIFEGLTLGALPLNGFLDTALDGCKFHWWFLSTQSAWDRGPSHLTRLELGGRCAYRPFQLFGETSGMPCPKGMVLRIGSTLGFGLMHHGIDQSDGGGTRPFSSSTKAAELALPQTTTR